MLMQEVTTQMLQKWQAVSVQYRHRLIPNRKTGAEIVAYLKDQYPLRGLDNAEALHIVSDTVLQNKELMEKLPKWHLPSPVAFIILDTGNGHVLYEKQDHVFRGSEIFVGVDLQSGYFCVEGSSLLWDALYAFQGLDATDIQNDYCVAEYIACLNRFDLLDDILPKI